MDLKLAYYGYVFDASGYGCAARAYIHALHTAGIDLAVHDLAGRPRQVNDELVESLVGRGIDPDFHLFHGIPPQWAQQAFRLPNAIGMTVWETDTMPTQWRRVLNHVLEVWLPCEFNVSAFKRGVSSPVFKLPHPLPSLHLNGSVPEPHGFLGLSPSAFVFYSIFEWQDRKSPDGLIDSYLRAFRDAGDVSLIIKANPGAAEVARHAVDNARRATQSAARVSIRCEAWTEGQVEALHARGNCYVSLHRGEGWGYPLFEAASRGTPVIATQYSGPLEYLSADDHAFVRYRPASVQQAYLYYHPRMRWADPDFGHAGELMRWVFDNHETAKSRAGRAASRIRESYSPEAIGAMARDRLFRLLKRVQPARWHEYEKGRRAKLAAPAVPIPGGWYDADYFEQGLKSNWREGYSWHSFAGVFQEAAAFLVSMFPDAASFLDAGCGKGFLVRTLREHSKDCAGFDHSAWAIDHADETAKPFLSHAGVDDVTFDGQFDVIVALSLFESLSEVQAQSFLERARAWTRTALFATIAPFDTTDGDVSHITIRPREWWHELFLKTGWVQDPLHRAFERLCQNHELPRKMQWNVYVYAPGQAR